MTRRDLLKSGACAVAALAFWRLGMEEAAAAYPFTLTDAEWRKRLSPLAYNVLRKQATEHPFTSPLNKEHRAGTFKCAGCDQALFSSKTKFDSGTGWPSFWAPLPRATGTSRDMSLLYPRIEVHCARCGGHLGHVFDDGPPPTGKRYCMNGVALSFSAA
ncbi:peptide-methionine (R)-S-oxide reductase MsrB [Sphingobium chungangianum]